MSREKKEAPMGNSELMPCPFCGATAIKSVDNLDRGRIECSDCGAQSMWSNDINSSILSWNTRPAPVEKKHVDGIVNCDLCGTPCTIEGDTTKYYKPVEKKGMDEYKVLKILSRSETVDELPPYRCLPVGHEDWFRIKAKSICQTFKPRVDKKALLKILTEHQYFKSTFDKLVDKIADHLNKGE